MSSFPPSSTPPAGDDSMPESLPVAATESESTPAAAADSAPESQPAAGPAPEDSGPVSAADSTAEPQPAADPAPEDSGAVSAADAMAEPQPAAGPPQEDCGPQLKQLYPALFSNPPKPLKLRIQADIQARSPGLFTKPQLSAFLRRYTGGHGYLNAIVKATHRFDLDGNPGDELSDEHRQAAIDELARRRTNTQARRALEDEQRFNRSVLLRDFEQTKLDKAGFAALKGVPEGELDPLLERARKEAAEAPPPAANRDRRGPPNRGPRGEGGPREGQGQRQARPPRDASAGAAGAASAAADAPALDGAAPQARPDGPRGPRTDAPRGPRNDAPRGPRSDAPRGPQGPRSDASRGPQGPRSEAPRGPQGPRPDATRGPQGARTDGPRGPRPEGQRGPRADGPRGPRPDAPRGPRDDRQRDDRPRGPRPDDSRNSRPNVSSSPAVPTAMALAFSALRSVKAAPAADTPKPAPAEKSDK